MWLLCVLARTITLDAQTIAYNLDTRQFNVPGKVRVKQKDYTLTGYDLIMDDTFENLTARQLEVEKDKIHYFLSALGRKNAHRFTFDKATFSSCKGCSAKTCKPKTWSVKSKQITYDAEKNRVYHKSATLRMGRLPVLWLPYFSHPDFTVDYQKGFLFPQLNITKDFGVTIGLPYYYPFDAYTTLKVIPFITSQKKVAMSVVAQKLMRNGYSKIDTAFFPHKNREGHFFWTNRYDYFENTRIEVDVKRTTSLDYMNEFWWMHGKGLFRYEPLASQISVKHGYAQGLLMFKNHWIQCDEKHAGLMPNWTWEHDMDIAGTSVRSFHHFWDRRNFTHGLALEKHIQLKHGVQIMAHVQERLFYQNNKTEFVPKGIVKVSCPLMHQKHPWILTPFVQITMTRPIDTEGLDWHSYKTLMTQSFYDATCYKMRLNIGGSLVTPSSYTEWFADIKQSKTESDTCFSGRNVTHLTPFIRFNMQSAWSQKQCNCQYMENGFSFGRKRNHGYVGFIHAPHETSHLHVTGSIAFSDTITVHGGYIGNIDKTTAYYGAFQFKNECAVWEIGFIHRLIDRHKTGER
ncbi:MAG: hypothetical protein Q7T50_07135, partial [Candidatus Magasanikbacteria bacterium]|nr:hypothetical protein [Candidatus Magasanikbacteria bacterium]